MPGKKKTYQTVYQIIQDRINPETQYSIDDLATKYRVNYSTVKNKIKQSFVDKFYADHDLGDPPNMSKANLNLIRKGSYSSEDIAKHYNIGVEEVTPQVRDRYYKHIERNSPDGKGKARFNRQLHAFKEDIRRIFPKFEQILLDSSGKAVPLEKILKHPSVSSKFGHLIKKAFDDGFDPKMRTDAGANAFVRFRDAVKKEFPKIINVYGSGKASTKQALIDNLARQFSFDDTGSTNYRRHPYYKNLAQLNLMNLHPVTRVDAEAPYVYRNTFNPIFTQHGQRHPQSILNVHHNLDIGKGGLALGGTTVLPEEQHKAVHSDKDLARLKDQRPMVGGRSWNTIYGNVEEPKLNLRKHYKGAGKVALPAALWALAMGNAQAQDMPWVAADMLTGLDTRNFVSNYRNTYDQRFGGGRETWDEGKERAGQDWKNLWGNILSVPEKIRNIWM